MSELNSSSLSTKFALTAARASTISMCDVKLSTFQRLLSMSNMNATIAVEVFLELYSNSEISSYDMFSDLASAWIIVEFKVSFTDDGNSCKESHGGGSCTVEVLDEFEVELQWVVRFRPTSSLGRPML